MPYHTFQDIDDKITNKLHWLIIRKMKKRWHDLRHVQNLSQASTQFYNVLLHLRLQIIRAYQKQNFHGFCLELEAEVLPEVAPLRTTEADESKGLSEFQSEVVQLAAVLNGDHFLSSFPDEMSKKMNVKEAHKYVKGAVSRFIRASKEAIKLGADESAIVDMRSSLTTRSSVHN